jgi:hypothetical protein
MGEAEQIPVETAIHALELPILRALDAVPEPGGCRGLASITEMTGIPRELCRAVIRGMIDKGLAQYLRGLWSEDGMPAGAGYCITDKGRELVPAQWGDDD